MVETVALFFRSGGSMMWVILSVLAVAIAVIAERLHFYLVVCRDERGEWARYHATPGTTVTVARRFSTVPAGSNWILCRVKSRVGVLRSVGGRYCLACLETRRIRAEVITNI